MNSIKVEKALTQGAVDFLTANTSINTVGQGTIENLPTITSNDISWDNDNFDPQGKKLWASVFYVPNIPEGRTVGPRGIDEITGFMQIDFNLPPADGKGVCLAWEHKARIFFHPGRVFTHDGQSVLIISTGMGQGRIIERSYRRSLTISFRSHLNRIEVS